MQYNYSFDCYYSQENMKKFYQSINFSHFETLTLDKMHELDKKAEKLRNTLGKYKNRMSIMGIVANRLLASSKSLGLLTGDEIAYYYIKVVDNNLLYLELANLVKSKYELVTLCKRQFGVYDNVIIQLERYLVNRLDSLQIEKDAEMSI